jgi:hypothetical protein
MDPVTINPNTVYLLGQLRKALGLRPGTLPREIRLGRLRSSKRAGKVLVLGAWVLEWIETGERKRRRELEAAGNV